MKKSKIERYTAPEVSVFSLGYRLHVLEQYSQTGSVNDFVEGTQDGELTGETGDSWD